MWPRRKKKDVESQQAILNATQSLREVQSRDSDVHAVSRALKDLRETNHFADKLRVIMLRG